MNIQIITIGDEILIGQIIDTNSAWIAQQLNLIGAAISKITSVSDTTAAIQGALTPGLKEADVILITGGLGPTKDDITKKALAALFNVDMVFDQPTYDRILGMFKKWGRTPTPAHKEQCYMPANAQLLPNKMGTAPGMWFEYEGKVVVSMPGVPYEMKYLMENEVIPKLLTRFPAKPIVHRTIQTAGEGESRIAARIEGIEMSLPAHIKLAYLPSLGRVRLRFSGTGADKQKLEKEIDQYVKAVKREIPELIFGYEEDTLETVIGQLLKERGLTIATAESCTGGYLAHRITSISGSSAYFMGSVIAYDNAVKSQLLKVKNATLDTYGAVSEQTVKEMVSGTLALLNTDIAIAISGIAGPGGGTPDKPVGTIWLAIGHKDQTQTLLLHAGKDREKNIQYTANYALNLIRKFVTEQFQAIVI